MCIPLILQDKLPLAESFVTGHSHLERQLVTLLDSWCHPSFNVEKTGRYEVICGSRTHTFAAVQTCILVCDISTVSFLVCLWPNTAWVRSNPKCWQNISSDLWRNSTLTKVLILSMFSPCRLLFVCNRQHDCFVWHRTLSQCSAQEKAGFPRVPHVQEICGGKWNYL